MVEVTLLSRKSCAACAQALIELNRILADYSLAASVLDVDHAAEAGDPELRAEFGDRLPVILLDGEEHSYWEIDEPRLRRDLDGKDLDDRSR